MCVRFLESAYRSYRQNRRDKLRCKQYKIEDAQGFRTDPNYGIKIAIDPLLVSSTIVETISSGGYELVEARLVLQTVRADDRVLELGAGLGFLTALVCSVANRRRTAPSKQILHSSRLSGAHCLSTGSSNCR